MTVLQQFTENERVLLAALPYRAGLWVGESDNTGGQAASAAEMRALEAIVTGYVEDFCKSEFVEALMRETLDRRAQWDGWRRNIAGVPGECRRVIELLASRVDYRELTAFKHNLVEIAMGVAMAYQEVSDDAPFMEKLKIYAAYVQHRLACKFHKEKPLRFQDAKRISGEEHRAITALTRALRPFHAEGLNIPRHKVAA